MVINLQKIHSMIFPKWKQLIFIKKNIRISLSNFEQFIEIKLKNALLIVQ